MAFCFTTAGESHGPALTAILEGIPAGLPLAEEDLARDLARRQSGSGTGARLARGGENDLPRILGGVMNGRTTGAPIALQIANRDHANWQGRAVPAFTIPRPGHADLAAAVKYGYDDFRYALERASAINALYHVLGGTLSPLDGATGIDQDSTFAVSTAAGGSSHFVLTSSTPGAPTWIVSTIETSMTLPDLSGIGFSLPSGHAFSYQVLVTPQTATADDMVTGGGYFGPYHELALASQGGAPPTQDGSILIATGGTITPCRFASRNAAFD